MSERAAPFHCPYCGDDDLFPHEGGGSERSGPDSSGWECRSCLRAFTVKMLGMIRRPVIS